MAEKTYGIDLGTGNIKIYRKKNGVVVNERNMIAIEKKADIRAIGDEAYEMFERAPENIIISSPMQGGVIAEFNNMQIVIDKFITKLNKKGIGSTKNSSFYITVPTDITDVQKRAFYDLIDGSNVKSKKILIVNKPIADALGVGLDVTQAHGIMVINMGADTTEISVISLGGIVLSKLIPIGGNKLDDAISLQVKKVYGITIGLKTAENLKIKLASAINRTEETHKIMGRDLVTGLPIEVEVSSSVIYDAIQEPLHSIVDAAKIILERTPPELSADIIDNGIYLTGGSAQIKNFDKIIQDELDLVVNVSNNPTETVVKGLGVIMENPDLSKLAYPIKNPTYN